MNCWLGFIGPVRCGHTLLGAMLDAHPHVIMANEAKGILGEHPYKYKADILNKIQDTKYHFSIGHPEFAGRDFYIDWQWQNNTALEDAIVVGNKRSGPETRFWMENFPRNIDKFSKKLELPIKFIHLIRDVEDSVKSMCIMNGKTSLENYHTYKQGTENAEHIKERYSCYSLYMEDFINDPINSLVYVCKFIGIYPYKDWLRDCESIVVKK